MNNDTEEKEREDRERKKSSVKGVGEEGGKG